MTPNFNLNAYIEEMKACKPPFRCPFDHCGKVYKSSSGIIAHIQQCSSDKKDAMEETKDIPRPFFRSPMKDTLVYTESQKTVEFEAEGRFHKFSIYDALQLVAKEDYEASLPQDMLEKMVKNEEEAASTPASNKTGSKKRGKAPRFSTPKNPSLMPRNVDKATEKDENKDIQPIDKKLLKLPEAMFREISNYKLEPAAQMPEKYFKFVEKSLEELDKDVEYDMDEEDVAWLDIMNEKRSDENLSRITEDQFELLMDRLEKESYFQVALSGGSQNYNAPVDEDAICCVCMDGEATNTNVILFCDLCNLAVHQECYGVPYIPEGQWLCRRCLQSPSRSVECCLCPNKGGAFKQTDDGRWAHVVCGLWIPEVRFANTVFLEPIDSIANIPSARWKLPCRVCRPKGTVGACIQCHKNSCFAAFHVTCGLLAGLHMKMETVHESGPGGTSITVRKSAFCEQHTPADSDAKPRLDDVAALGIVTSKYKKSPKKSVDDHHPLPILFRGLMNFSPQCPWDKVQKIASLVDIQKKSHFIQRLMAYWTLKRQTRNGVPLIRRLQFAKATKSDKLVETPQKNSHHAIMADSKATIKELDSETDTDHKEKTKLKKEKKLEMTPRPMSAAEKAGEQFKTMSEERRKMRRLRQDLERVRLLCELIRKREQRKRELVAASADIKFLELNPFSFFLRKILDILTEQDTTEIFREPVDPDEVPDYLDLIKKPMDFSTMRDKVEDFKYETFDEFESDFNLMVSNCLAYNEKETIFYRAGTKMRDTGGSILRQLRRQAEQIKQMGLEQNSSVNQDQEELSDLKLMKEIDSFINEEDRDALSNEDHLQKLLVCSDNAQRIHHPVAKKKRIQILLSEIRKLRRKISLDKKEGKTEVDKSKKNTPGGRGRKRQRSSENEKEEVKVEEEEEEEKKSGKAVVGVNRRNAVLFTRKKAATEEKEDKITKRNDRSVEPEEAGTPGAKKPDGGDKFEFNEPSTPTETGYRGRKTRKGKELEKSILEAKAEKFMGGPKMDDEMFQTYRGSGGVDTDTDTGAESTNDLNTTDDDDSSSDSGDDSYCGVAALDIPLEPLDLVWAKCRGYPWYPALIINPKMPRTGYFHNGVPIPVPPIEVLNLAETHTKPHYLILFFDTKRTWQWLPRDKLEPLGVDTDLDKTKLTESRKASEKKAVKKAYEEAILHRCRVTGESIDLKTCQTKEQDSEEKEEEEEKTTEKLKKKK